MPEETNQPAQQPEQNVQAAVPSDNKGTNKKSKLLVGGIVAGAILLAGAASAGAYFGIVVPNKPENVLKKSFENAVQQKQVSGKGRAEFTSKEKDAKPVIVNYSVQSDNTKNTFDVNVDAAYSGAKLPVEIRGVDKSIFVKVGDLGSIKGVVALSAPEASPFIDQVAGKLSNQWIEIDESLMKTITKDDSCSVEKLKLTDKDIQDIIKAYGNNEFVTAKNSSSDTVNGKKVTKYELSLDKKKAKSFGSDLEDLDFVKRLDKCSTSAGTSSKESAKTAEDKFKGTASLNVWIDKSKKEIVKIGADVKDDESGTLAIDFTYNKDKIDIKKPDGAKPALQVFGELGPLFSGVLGGAPTTGTTGTGTGATGTSTQCESAYQAFIASGGTTQLPANCLTEQ